MDTRLRGGLPPRSGIGTASTWTHAAGDAHAEQISLPATIAIFLAAFVLTAWPWLSGHVTIPWDAKSQFFPQVQFLATSIAHGEWPWWTPHVFAGWPQISDPQSLMFSPLHVLLAALDPAISLRAFDAVIFVYLALGGIGIILFFRDRGWHAGGAVVAALAFALGGAASARIQHIGQVVSLAYLPLILWLLARALERASWRAGLAAGALAGLLAIGRDQVALLCLYVLAGYVLTWWLTGDSIVERLRASLKPLSAAALSGALVATVPVVMTSLLAARSNRPEVSFEFGRRRLDPSGASVAARLCRPVRRDGPESRLLGPAESRMGCGLGLARAVSLPEHAAGLCGRIADPGHRGVRPDPRHRVRSRHPVLHHRGRPDDALRARRLHAGVPPDVRTAVRRALSPRRPMPHLSFARCSRSWPAIWCIAGSPARCRPRPGWQRALEIIAAAALVATAFAVAAMVVGIGPAIVPVATALAFSGAAIAILVLARRADPLMPTAAVALLALFMAGDLRLEQRAA